VLCRSAQLVENRSEGPVSSSLGEDQSVSAGKPQIRPSCVIDRRIIMEEDTTICVSISVLRVRNWARLEKSARSDSPKPGVSMKDQVLSTVFFNALSQSSPHGFQYLEANAHESWRQERSCSGLARHVGGARVSWKMHRTGRPAGQPIISRSA